MCAPTILLLAYHDWFTAPSKIKESSWMGRLALQTEFIALLLGFVSDASEAVGGLEE
jgi:hypothetical protein